MKDANEITQFAVNLRKENRFEEAEILLRTAIDKDVKAWQQCLPVE